MPKNRILNIEDRKRIENLLHSGTKHRIICDILGINRTTFYREMKRCKESYNAEVAQSTCGNSKNLIDFEIIGKRFGLLVVDSYANIYKKRSWWKCRCDCGRWTIVCRKKLLDYCSKKRPLSCGCIAKQWHSADVQLPIEELALRKFQDLLKFRKIESDCWEWQGYVCKKGIPRCSWRNKAMSVRKCMYLLMNGLIHESRPVFTTCDNHLCFNPSHLTL